LGEQLFVTVVTHGQSECLSDEEFMKQDQIIDGYSLRKRIGTGGFGEVWLCEPVVTPAVWKALKWVPSSFRDKLDRELDALVRYQRAMLKNASKRLMRIEHANRTDEGLFYVMPLADGIGDAPPDSHDWKPASLWHLMEQRKSNGTWFSSDEIVAVMDPVLEGLQELSDMGLLHRDLKPENILYVQGMPMIADVSLLGEDLPNPTRRGTPGFAAPSWYLEGGGHPDQFGAGATLFSLITGNTPDKMGRAAYRWPPGGVKSLSEVQRKQWLAMHQIVYRATHEDSSERFQDFSAMRYALSNLSASSGELTKKTRSPKALLVVFALAAVFICGTFLSKLQKQTNTGTTEVEKSAAGLDNLFRAAMKEYGRTDQPRDLILVSRLLHNGAMQGHAKAQNMRGYIHLLEGENFDPKAAAPWFLKAAEQGDAAGQYNLGCCYFWGFGVEKDEAMALRYFKLSSDQDFFPAHSILGFCAYTEIPPVEDLSNAIGLLRRAAEKGREEAIYLLSVIAETRDGLPVNDTTMVSWRDKLASITYSPMQSLNAIWADELGISSWRAANFIMTQKMSTEAQPNPMYEFDDAIITRKETGGRVSFEIQSSNPELTEDRILRALETNRRAAGLRNPDAELWIGKAYLTGRYLELSPANALPWLRRAAEQGKEQAVPLIKDALLKLRAKIRH
jgi:TPR repeat protein